MKFQSLFSVKNKKKISVLLSADYIHRVVKVKYSRLSLSQIPRDSIKYFEISVPRHVRVERVRKTIN